MIRLLAPGRPLGWADLSAFAGSHGLPTWYARPTEGGAQSVLAAHGDRFVRLATLAGAGVQLLSCDDSLVDAVASAFAATPVEEILARPADDRLPAARLAAAVLRTNGPAEPARSVLVDALSDPDPLVRRFAGSQAWLLADRDGLERVRAAAERHPDLAFAVDALALQIREVEAGTLGDAPTTDFLELRRRAEEAVANGQLERARRTGEALFERDACDAWGIWALGVALAPEDPLAARFLLGAAASSTDSDGEPEIPDAAARLAALPDGSPTDATVDRVLRFVEAWRASWYPYASLLASGARALAGRLPPLDPLLDYVLASYDRDLARLEAAAAALPGVPSIRSRLAELAEPARAGVVRAELVADLRRGVVQSELERRIEAALRGEDGPLTLASELGRWARAAYEAKDLDRAVALADEALALGVGDVDTHQVRALALTVSERLGEAVDAYGATLAALDARDGLTLGDPRPQLWFNRACCEARLGRRVEALDDLRRAVASDPKYAVEAATDDWLTSLRDDPELRAITARDPEALVLSTHRTAEHAVALLAQGIDAENRGDVAEAAERAREASEVALRACAVEVRVEALARWARAAGFAGQLDQALEIARQAVAEAERGEVPARMRGEAYAQLGVVRSLRGEPAEAREAYLLSLEARQETGDPLLVARSELTLTIVDLGLGDVAAARARVDRALPVLEAAVEAGAPAAVHDDLATARVRRAVIASGEGDRESARAALSAAVEGLERMKAAGAAPLPGIVQSIDDLASALGEAEVVLRVRALVSSGSAEVDRVRAVFRDLRLAIALWRRGGADDATIAGWLREVIGGRAVPEHVEEALRPFRSTFVALAAQRETLLVSTALAVDLMATGLERGLRDLEELWASAAQL